MANAKVLAAWDDTKPYCPPQAPLMVCTKLASSGLWQGRKRINTSLNKSTENWSEKTMSKAIKGAKIKPRHLNFIKTKAVNIM